MSSSLDLRGVYVPLVTPFAASGAPALDEVARLAQESLDAGAAGIVALGTTGEPATLDAGERGDVIEAIAEVCLDASAQLVIGAGSNSTAAAVADVETANEVAGVTAILSVVPYYTRPSETGIVAHFRALAEASEVPIILYNIPYRTGRALGAESLLALANTPNVAGLKQAVGGIDTDTLGLMAGKPAGFHVLSGDDAFLFPLLCLGGTGAVAASSHFCTAGFVALVDAALHGDVQSARQYAEILLPVCQALFVEPSPGVIKGVLAAQGRISTADLRLPMTEASPASVAAALDIVAAAEKALADRLS